MKQIKDVFGESVNLSQQRELLKAFNKEKRDEMRPGDDPRTQYQRSQSAQTGVSTVQKQNYTYEPIPSNIPNSDIRGQTGGDHSNTASNGFRGQTGGNLTTKSHGDGHEQTRWQHQNLFIEQRPHLGRLVSDSTTYPSQHESQLQGSRQGQSTETPLQVNYQHQCIQQNQQPPFSHNGPTDFSSNQQKNHVRRDQYTPASQQPVVNQHPPQYQQDPRPSQYQQYTPAPQQPVVNQHPPQYQQDPRPSQYQQDPRQSMQTGGSDQPTFSPAPQKPVIAHTGSAPVQLHHFQSHNPSQSAHTGEPQLKRSWHPQDELEKFKQDNAHLLAENTKLSGVLESLMQEKEQMVDKIEAAVIKEDAAKQDKELADQEILSLRNELKTRSSGVWKVSADKVEIGTEIGVGGWGTVLNGNIKVAIKRLHPAILNPCNISRIKREMKLLAEVQHSNLVQFIGTVYDEEVERDQKPPLILIELLDMNLRQAYEQNNLQPTNHLSIFTDVAQALNYLHQRYEPIIHRDVSAPNVLLQRLPGNMWRGKVSDLGSANFLKQASTMGDGAILYSPSEVIPRAFDHSQKHMQQTVKIDVYSYGVLLCEVNTSRLPDAGNYREMIEHVQREQPQMHALIVHCTQEDPKDRPTMADVLVALHDIHQV